MSWGYRRLFHFIGVFSNISAFISFYRRFSKYIGENSILSAKQQKTPPQTARKASLFPQTPCGLFHLCHKQPQPER